ncbi:MAG TPA: YidC/Oxa1 family insertase periplasmic-domain containing protein [Candidatus Bathyarchaeia archaeon]|nr:YidC/Oxa1 family insertase periplasmic-domain containing protein [Candidatus Bathyarchaeia archaeon]
MEKRIIFSFLLCFLVLLLWQKMFPEQPVVVAPKATQTTENKELTEETQGLFQKQEEEMTRPVYEEMVVLKNEKIEVGLIEKTGTIQRVLLQRNDVVLPVDAIADFKIGEEGEAIYKILKNDGKEIVFSSIQGDFLIQKTYRLSDDDYLVYLDVEVENRGMERTSIDPLMKSMVVNTSLLEETAENQREQNLLEYSINAGEKIIRKAVARKFSHKENKTEPIAAQWVGFRNRYYCAIFKPNFSVTGYRTQALTEKRLALFLMGERRDLRSGEKAVFSNTIYFGPQNGKILSGYQMGLEKIHAYFRLGFFDAIAKIIEDLMVLMHKIFPNWGVSIILVSFLIYLVMYPMTMKSMVSMRKMQSLQPKIVELREKHDKNPQKLNQEIMKLYAENKVNPLGGCLPLLLQMPIFICLYQVIWRSPVFNGAGFLWIQDLSAPDRLVVFSSKYPVIGNEFNLLPVLIVILMVFQQKMTTKNMVTTDPNQIAQQKMMLFVMPVMLFFFFYHIASGLSLYLMVFYLLSSFTQWKASRTTKAVNV